MVMAPNLESLDWVTHGFGERDSTYPPGITTLRQIHSSIVKDVSSLRGDRITEGDGLFTDNGRTLIGVRTADCVPILLADRRTRKVAAVHAGWRGTAAGNVAATLSEMDSKPEEIVAAIGPSNGGCCYEVGPNVVRQFGSWMPDLEHLESASKIDLNTVNRLQLKRAGVAAGSQFSGRFSALIPWVP